MQSQYISSSRSAWTHGEISGESTHQKTKEKKRKKKVGGNETMILNNTIGIFSE